MPNLAANLSTMFGEWSFLDRIGAAADAGFAAVECQFPYEEPSDKIAARLSRCNLEMILINTPASNEDGMGLIAVPGRQEDCRAGLQKALEYCRELDVNLVHVMSGCPSFEHSTDACRRVLKENVRYAADLFAPYGITALLEPINTFDVPGYYLSRSIDAVALLDDVGRENVALQFDLYHAYRMGESLEESLRTFSDNIAHIQISGHPGRHEPDIGEIDYPPLLELIDVIGYDGWVGCEYKPKSGTLEGLGWARAYGVTAPDSR